jgi:hypothetical protein
MLWWVTLVVSIFILLIIYQLNKPKPKLQRKHQQIPQTRERIYTKVESPQPFTKIEKEKKIIPVVSKPKKEEEFDINYSFYEPVQVEKVVPPVRHEPKVTQTQNVEHFSTSVTKPKKEQPVQKTTPQVQKPREIQKQNEILTSTPQQNKKREREFEYSTPVVKEIKKTGLKRERKVSPLNEETKAEKKVKLSETQKETKIEHVQIERIMDPTYKTPQKSQRIQFSTPKSFVKKSLFSHEEDILAHNERVNEILSNSVQQKGKKVSFDIPSKTEEIPEKLLEPTFDEPKVPTVVGGFTLNVEKKKEKPVFTLEAPKVENKQKTKETKGIGFTMPLETPKETKITSEGFTLGNETKATTQKDSFSFEMPKVETKTESKKEKPFSIDSITSNSSEVGSGTQFTFGDSKKESSTEVKKTINFDLGTPSVQPSTSIESGFKVPSSGDKETTFNFSEPKKTENPEERRSSITGGDSFSFKPTSQDTNFSFGGDPKKNEAAPVSFNLPSFETTKAPTFTMETKDSFGGFNTSTKSTDSIGITFGTEPKKSDSLGSFTTSATSDFTPSFKMNDSSSTFGGPSSFTQGSFNLNPTIESKGFNPTTTSNTFNQTNPTFNIAPSVSGFNQTPSNGNMGFNSTPIQSNTGFSGFNPPNSSTFDVSQTTNSFGTMGGFNSPAPQTNSFTPSFATPSSSSNPTSAFTPGFGDPSPFNSGGATATPSSSRRRVTVTRRK